MKQMTWYEIEEAAAEAADRAPLTEDDLPGDVEFPEGCVNCAWGLRHQH